MATLGFRSDPNNPRIAIVTQTSSSTFELVNADSETKLIFPADASSDEEKVAWLYREFDRIFHAHPEIERVIVKKGEFTVADNNAKRFASYQEAVALIYCGLKSIPVVAKLYASLATNGTKVKNDAENRVGRTAKYWDAKMADAVVAGWWGEKNK